MQRPDSLPQDWQVLKRKPKKSGQATVIFVRHKDGRKGVYRELKGRPSDIQRKRFQRELEILSNKVQHRSIVALYDWSIKDDHLWYISELGDPFKEWWQRQRKKLVEKPEELVELAVSVIRDISAALSLCHEIGIVHRDIKLANLIVKKGVPDPWPILIDFGIAHDEEGNRFTSSIDAVGNERFSPDIMRSRLDEVPPWLDVFDLAQLLIWMLEVKVPKHYWRRPVHWKYALYSDTIPDRLQMSIRAFTAACSTKVISPANAAQAMALLDTLFPQHLPVPNSGVDPNVIVNAKRLGEAKSLLTNATIQEEIESAAPQAEVVYLQLRDAILSALEEISRQEPSAQVLIDNPFHYQIIGATDLLSVCVGSPECSIVLRIKAKVVTRSDTLISNQNNHLFWQKYMSKDAICFTFALEGGVPEAHNSQYEDGRWITIDRDGSICLHPLGGGFFGRFSNNDLGGGAEGPGVVASMSGVGDFAISVFTNEQYWAYCQERVAGSQMQ